MPCAIPCPSTGSATTARSARPCSTIESTAAANLGAIDVAGTTYTLADLKSGKALSTLGDNIKTAETSNGKEREIFNQLKYVVPSGPAKDLSVKLRGSWLRVSNDARSYNDDGNEVRVFVEYPVNIF